MVLKIFSARVREARLAAGMTQSDLDAALGLKPGCVAKWEAGVRLPQHDNLDRLAEVTGLPYAFFFGATSGATSATSATKAVATKALDTQSGGPVSKKLLKARVSSKLVAITVLGRPGCHAA